MIVLGLGFGNICYSIGGILGLDFEILSSSFFEFDLYMFSDYLIT